MAATYIGQTALLRLNATKIKSTLINSNKTISKLKVERIKLIDKASELSVRQKREKVIESPIKGIKPILGGLGNKLVGMARPIKDTFLNVFGLLLLGFAVDKLPKIVEKLTVAFNTVKPIWDGAVSTLGSLFSGIIKLKPFADTVIRFIPNLNLNAQEKELKNADSELQKDLDDFDSIFGEVEEPKEEKETGSIFSQVGDFFTNLFKGSQPQPQQKTAVKPTPSTKPYEWEKVAQDYGYLIKDYKMQLDRNRRVEEKKRGSTPSGSASPQTSSPSPSSSSSAPSTSGAGLNGILKFISKGEGGYNAMNQGTVGNNIVGSTQNASGKVGKNLTDMTLGEIMKRQAYLMNPNNPQISNYGLFAVGRYQIIPDTFPRAMRYAGLGPNDKFSPANQDKMGVGLIKGDAPAAWSYITGKSNDINGAINSLAAVWASIPTTSGRSAYGQGNAAGHSVAEVKNALISARNSYGRGSSNLNPIRQNRTIPQSNTSTSGGVNTVILPFGFEKLIPLTQAPTQSEVNSYASRNRFQRSRGSNLP